MYILDDGIKLNAQIDLPTPAKGKHPMVVILHGFTGHMEERHLVGLSRALNEIGFATLRVDLYGHGKSEGAFRDHTLYKWLTNAMTVIDYARGLDFVTDLYLCGHSQGGLTAILAGGLKHEVIRGIIPLAPACMIPDLARSGGLLGTSFDPNRIPEELTVWGNFVLGSNYVRAAQTLHVEEAIDRYDGPVLVVQGDHDDPGLQQSAIAAARRYRHGQLRMIPGDTHCFDHHLDQMIAAVTEWLQQQAAARPGA